MRKSFAVYAATVDEANEGWVWFDSALPSRTIVKVTNDGARRSVYCVSRKIDENFLANYNTGSRTRITDVDVNEALVMSQWYRDALGGIVTTTRSDGKRVGLTIAQSKMPLWGSIRAACHHPDIVARVGTRLGVLGAWLGLIGLVPPVFNLRGVKADDLAVGWTQISVAVIGTKLRSFT